MKNMRTVICDTTRREKLAIKGDNDNEKEKKIKGKIYRLKNGTNLSALRYCADYCSTGKIFLRFNFKHSRVVLRKYCWLGREISPEILARNSYASRIPASRICRCKSNIWKINCDGAAGDISYRMMYKKIRSIIFIYVRSKKSNVKVWKKAHSNLNAMINIL